MADEQHEALEAVIARHAPFLNHLARALVGDEDRAADLVQDTWAAALRQPTPLASAGARKWLSVILRRRSASAARRASLRRMEPLDSPAGKDDVPDDVAVRLERQEIVQAALRELAEPYRTALVLRFQDGLSSAEVASRTGQRASTVRSHVTRGLAQLREALDRQHPGGRAEWLAALAPLAVPAGAPVTTAVPTASTLSVLGAALIMKTLALGAVIVIAVAATYLLAGRPRPAVGPSAVPPTVATTIAPGSLEEPPLADGQAAARDRESLAVRNDSLAGGAAASEPEQPPLEMWSGRVVTADGEPVAGASVRRCAEDNALRARSGLPALLVQPVFTDQDGVFRTERPRQGEAVLIEKAGHARRFLLGPVSQLEDATWSYGDIVLGDGYVLRGHVLGPDMLPVAGADVVPLMMDGASTVLLGSSLSPEPLAVTDSVGAFTIERVPAGRWSLRARHPRFLPGETAGEILIGASPSQSVELHMRAAGSLSGVVRYLPDGFGSAGTGDPRTVSVSVRPVTQNDDVESSGHDRGARRYSVAADGSFRVTGQLPGANLWVDLWTDAYSHAESKRCSARVTAKEGDDDVVLEYASGFDVTVVAIHAITGEPIHVAEAVIEFGTTFNELEAPETEDVDHGWLGGPIVAQGLVAPQAGRLFHVRLWAAGMEPLSADFPAGDNGTVVDLGALQMRPKEAHASPPVAARIRVEAVNGTPLPHAGVSVFLPGVDRENGRATRLRAGPDGVADLKTDDEGEAWARIDPYFRVGNNQPGVAASSVSASDFEDDAASFTIRRGEITELTLRLPEAGRVRLEVERDGAPLTGVEVMLTEFGERRRSISRGNQYLRWGERSRWASVDEDGAVTIERLEPGSWLVAVRDRTARQVVTRRTVIRRGEQTIRVPFPATRITGRVQLPDGTPVSGAHVTISSGSRGVDLAMRDFHDQGYSLEERSATSYATRYAGCAVSGEDGRFALGFVPEGIEIVVNATARDHTSVRSAMFVCDGTPVTLEPLVIEPAGTLRITAPPDASDPWGVVAESGVAAKEAFAIGQSLAFRGGSAILRGQRPGRHVIYWFMGEEGTLEDAQRIEVNVIGGEIIDIELKMPGG